MQLADVAFATPTSWIVKVAWPLHLQAIDNESGKQKTAGVSGQRK